MKRLSNEKAMFVPSYSIIVNCMFLLAGSSIPLNFVWCDSWLSTYPDTANSESVSPHTNCHTSNETTIFSSYIHSEIIPNQNKMIDLPSLLWLGCRGKYCKWYEHNPHDLWSHWFLPWSKFWSQFLARVLR